jgi:hypothetical protein
MERPKHQSTIASVLQGPDSSASSDHEREFAMRKHPPFITRPWCFALYHAAFLALLIGALVVVPQAAEAQGRRYMLTLQNRSSYDIHRLFMSPSDVENWGPDQLGTRVIHSGQSFTLTNITPGEYDIAIADEDGDKCILKAVPIFNDKSWSLSDQNLLQCQDRTSKQTIRNRSLRHNL